MKIASVPKLPTPDDLTLVIGLAKDDMDSLSGDGALLQEVQRFATIWGSRRELWVVVIVGETEQELTEKFADWLAAKGLHIKTTNTTVSKYDPEVMG